MSALLLTTATLAFIACAPADRTGDETDTDTAGSAAATPAVDTEAIADTIRSLEQRWSGTAGNRDADAFTAFYAQDGRLMPPNAPAAVGQEAIHEVASHLFADTATTLSFGPTDVHVAESGDMVWEHGTWEAKNAAGENLDNGKYIVAWKRAADGSWKVAADIFNSDNPPAADQ